MQKFTLLFIFLSFMTNAQVGIGTTTPASDLHVVGDILVQNGFTVGALNTVTAAEKDFKLITRVTNSIPVGEVTELDVSTIFVAPINTIDYHFTNISLDNLTDVDLLYDETKYVIAVSNFRYVGDAIKKRIINGDRRQIGHFVVHTFVSGGTWHLEIRNRNLDLDVGDSLEYYVTLVVYDKSFYRHLTPITTTLNGNNTGTASSIPILY
jgi:hypothetical protein